MGNTFEFINMNTTEGRSKAAEHETVKAEQIAGGQQLFARIKKSSKYHCQGEPGALFPVYVVAGPDEGYTVQGGPGGQYRLRDVNLFVVENGREMRIS